MKKDHNKKKKDQNVKTQFFLKLIRNFFKITKILKVKNVQDDVVKL